MLWALLAILGVPIWLVLGALGASLWNRRRFRAQADVFAVRYRQVSSGGTHGWSRKAYARWVHDVLLANTGIALVRTAAYAVRSRSDAPDPDPAECRKLGDRPVAITIELDDGRVFEVAAAGEDRVRLTEPFVDASTEPE